MSQYMAYQHTNDRINIIKNILHDHQFIEIWEHTWDYKCANDMEIKKFIKEHAHMEEMNIRDGLYGG